MSDSIGDDQLRAIAAAVRERALREGGALQLSLLILIDLADQATEGMPDDERLGAGHALATLIKHLPDGAAVSRRCFAIRRDTRASLQMLKD